MGITLNYTTIEAAESKDNWEVIGDAEGLEDSSYTPKQGDQCVGWELAPNKFGGIRNKNAVTPFDIREVQVALWFLNPVADKDSNIDIKNSEDGLFLRLYSGSDYADFYQPDLRKADGNWKGGWIRLIASGGPGEEDANSGTWGVDQVSSVDRVAVMVHEGDGDTTDKDSGNYGTDWSLYYDKIVVTGDNDGTPWTLQDIFDTDRAKPDDDGVWGLVDKAVDFYNIHAGIEFGDGNSGEFHTENEYILLNQRSNAVKYNITVKDKFKLTLGVKDTGTIDYAKNGTGLTAIGRPDITVENGATLEVYDSKIQGFNTIQLGSAGSANVTMVKAEIYDNTSVLYDSDTLDVTNSRMYYDSNNKGDIGKVATSPQRIEDIMIFNTNTGLELDVDIDIKKYTADSNTYDIAIKDSNTVNLLDSTIDTSKIKRT